MTFFVDGVSAATTTVNPSGEALFLTSALTPGAHTVAASFATSSANFVSSKADSIVQHVTRDVVVLGADVGSLVIVMDARTNEEVFRFEAFPGFRGGVTVAAGDVNGDSVPDIVAGTGPGGGSLVAVFDGVTRAAIQSFLAFPGFSGGVSVAAGDVNGDGRDDIIVGVAVNGHVKVFSGANNALLASFFAYPGFTGGVSVAAGDVNGDGRADIITGAALNGHVKVFDGATNALLTNFFAYPGFTGGVNVAAGDVNGDGRWTHHWRRFGVDAREGVRRCHAGIAPQLLCLHRRDIRRPRDRVDFRDHYFRARLVSLSRSIRTRRWSRRIWRGTARTA